MNVSMYPILLAIIGILVLTGIIAVLVWKKRKEKSSAETDYRVFFILGICWFPLGIVFMSTDNPMGFVFFIVGVVYLVIGLANRDKWKNE
jgi:LPXTG-motif cell wall-anchored protein